MSEESPRQITIGEDTYRIARFRGLKAALAGSLISRVMREVPELQSRVAEFRKEFRTRNTVIVTPAMAKLPSYAGLGLEREDFEAAGGNIELPEEPDQGTILVNVFPDLFDLARKELERFLALIVISNQELESADDAEEVDEVLSKKGKMLMRSGDLDELLELFVVGSEVFKDQMSAKRERLGKIPIPFLQRLLAPEETPEPEELETSEPESSGPGPSSPTPIETNPSPSESSVPPLSTDSPNDSDGQEETSFTESLGTNSN